LAAVLSAKAVPMAETNCAKWRREKSCTLGAVL
jgi:hypothetical protein